MRHSLLANVLCAALATAGAAGADDVAFVVADGEASNEEAPTSTAHAVIAAGELGEPAARAGFDLYLDDAGAELTYHKEPCAPEDVRGRFYLHVFPADPAELMTGDERQSGFSNHSFFFRDHGALLPGGACIALVPLPAYEGGIARFRTSQGYDGESIWEADFRGDADRFRQAHAAIAAGERGAPDAVELAPAKAPDDAVSTAEVLEVLEEINLKLDHGKRMRSGGAPDSGIGGGPHLPFRYLLGTADLNAYVKQLGSYDAMSEFFFPFVNGGAGTLRWSLDRNLQLGMEYGKFSQEVRGFAKHSTDAAGPRDTVDANGDGYDDYYSYAGYVQRYFAGVFQYKWEAAPDLLYVTAGVKTGLAFERLRYGMNRRQVLTDTLGAAAGGSAWKRTSLLGSAYAGLQIGLDGGLNVFKLGIEAGVTGHYALAAWAPAIGVHRGAPAPPNTWQAHNVWVSIGPQFHY